ncbi:MAG: hypothetical protein GKR93_05810 [Gammaproteobacteria bacterium]|nr:hypothetical protein [Gammaproteobacteria bacterium]
MSISFVYAANMSLELIPLQYRTTDEIIPIIRPLLVDGASLSGANNQLIIKTTSANLAEIRQILAGIDIAARRLLITVKQDVEGQIDRRDQGISGKYSTGDVSISSNNRRDNNRGIVLSAKDKEGNNIRYRDLSTRSDLDDANTFQVQTVDGKAAYVQTGQQVPIANQNAFLTPGGVVIQDTINYHDVSSGFYVLPRVNGDRVTLQISPRLSRVQPNQAAIFEVQNAETTTIGRLGEWIQIGGITQQFNRNKRENLRSTRQNGQEQRSILVKVEEIP